MPSTVFTPTAQFLGTGALCGIGLVALNVALTGGVGTLGALGAMVFYGLALALGVRGLAGFPHRSIGLCNVVTIVRLALVAGLIAALISPFAGPWVIFALAVLALSLDGLDGWLARHSGLASQFGARFDMEVDAALAMTLALLAFAGGHVGGFILLLGLPRYVFWLAQFPLPWMSADLPERFSRKVVCVVQIAVLIAALLPGLERPFTDMLAATAALALIWSFWLDITWLRDNAR